MSGFTDIHAHFLYGLDDGAKTRKEMESMLDAAAADGIASLFATPHVTLGLAPFDHEIYGLRVSEANRYCDQMGYDLRIYSGAEVMYTPVMDRFTKERRLPTLAGSEFVLIEFVPGILFSELEDAVGLLERYGYVPVLAHIERYGCLRHRKAYLLKERHDVRYQINCDSVIASHTLFGDRWIRRSLRNECIDFVATDSHDCRRRPTRMKEAYTVLAREYGKDYAYKLTGLSRGLL